LPVSPKLTLAHQTMFADLVQRCQDASFDAQYPEGGSFVRHTRSGRDYWYYVPSIRVDPARTHIYVGPATTRKSKSESPDSIR
jgi:hypothetical protein